MNGMSDVKEIYNALADELSRYIYRQRLLYSLLGEASAITEMVRVCYPDAKLLESEKLCYYGAGAAVGWIIRCCGKRSFVVDRYKRGTVDGLPIISLEEFLQRPDFRDYTLVVTAGKEELKKEIAAELDSYGLNFVFAYFGTQYFDLAELALGKDEAFADVGALDGETSRFFLNHFGGRVCLFEPNPDQFAMTRERLGENDNVDYYPCGLYDRDGTVRFSPNPEDSGTARVSEQGELEVKVARLDSVLAGKRVTFIKMDIEGSELAALHGAAETIRTQKPRLAICVYHKPEDMWEIPSYILSLNSDYKLYFRHYSITDTETVLYAVP